MMNKKLIALFITIATVSIISADYYDQRDYNGYRPLQNSVNATGSDEARYIRNADEMRTNSYRRPFRPVQGTVEATGNVVEDTGRATGDVVRGTGEAASDVVRGTAEVPGRVFGGIFGRN